MLTMINLIWNALIQRQKELVLVQTIVTIFAVGIAVYEIRRWKKQHVNERESNFYFELIQKIENLRFLILEMRAPTFLWPNKVEAIERDKIPQVNTIKMLSFSIAKELSIMDKLNQCGNNLSNLYRKNIGTEIIRDIGIEAYTFIQSNDKPNVPLPILAPTEEAKCKPGSYDVDYTGLGIIKDEFFDKLNTNFEAIICALSKKLIMIKSDATRF